jgi:hypothetical protein
VVSEFADGARSRKAGRYGGDELRGDADRNHGRLLAWQFLQADGARDGVDRSVGMAGFGEVTSKAGPFGTRADETNAAEPTGPDRRVA